MIFSNDDDAPIALDLAPDWAARLGPSAARLELEIGCGHGGFALGFAAAYPDRALVAIEQRRAFAEEVAEKRERRGHANLVVIQGDARILAPRLFHAGSLAAIHVHFPDPWWKRRHVRRRLVDDRMSTLLLGLLAPGGLLDFRTDVERYAREAVVRLEEAGFENEAGPGAFAERPPDEIPSTREKRYLETGQPVWRLRMRKPE
ncbi:MULTISPECIES: tRNA (guanosine(46)-N7)-methyltransferase TrmB [unclassified Anaeromyxobacter]|uniref:tRNA (guanosine(46)-N7)-methyltransferase TrmB n=1 Tax=unclassified Anaeromyxobacter TaxID=2620896 RepID=UPI001F58089A|nr:MULTISPECIES: tRNA (guanosine(46)-N7)-methyltransferase TrmB [unclassified Anaeromyxobacter]